MQPYFDFLSGADYRIDQVTGVTGNTNSAALERGGRDDGRRPGFDL